MSSWIESTRVHSAWTIWKLQIQTWAIKNGFVWPEIESGSSCLVGPRSTIRHLRRVYLGSTANGEPSILPRRFLLSFRRPSHRFGPFKQPTNGRSGLCIMQLLPNDSIVRFWLTKSQRGLADGNKKNNNIRRGVSVFADRFLWQPGTLNSKNDRVTIQV